MEEKEQQELIYKLSMFEQQMQQIQQQLQIVEQGIAELITLNVNLDNLKDSKDKEIFAPIGRGMFVKAKLLSENLTVDIGGKKFVKKSISEAKKLLDEQIKKLGEVQVQLTKSLDDLNGQVIELMKDVEKERK